MARSQQKKGGYCTGDDGMHVAAMMWPSPSKPELRLPFGGLLYCPSTNVGDVRRPQLDSGAQGAFFVFNLTTFTGAPGAAEHLPNRLEEKKKNHLEPSRKEVTR